MRASFIGLFYVDNKEKAFLERLHKKYNKKNFEFLKDGNNQTIAVDGEPLNLSWNPPLNELSDTYGEATEVLYEDCIIAIKESIQIKKDKKRKAKKAYLNKKIVNK